LHECDSDLAFAASWAVFGGRNRLTARGEVWQVNHIDWQKRVAYVESTAADGKSRWQGEGQALGCELCQTIKRVLTDQSEREFWSRRARERIAVIRANFSWLESDSSVIVTDSNGTAKWWTFAGGRANATLANEVGTKKRRRVHHDNFTVTFASDVPFKEIECAIAEIGRRDATGMCAPVDEQAIGGLKFSECLPKPVALEMLQERMTDSQALGRVLQQQIRFAKFASH
jgi:ATP-dependent Lhr-like helicase